MSKAFRMSVKVTRPAGCNVKIVAAGWTPGAIVANLIGQGLLFFEDRIEDRGGVLIARVTSYAERDSCDQDDYIDFQNEGDPDEETTYDSKERHNRAGPTDDPNDEE